MLEPSPKKNILVNLVFWHYFYALKQAFVGWANFLSFTFHYFSAPFLLKTFFSHWRKVKEAYPRGFDIKAYPMIFIGNMASRALGAFVRAVFIILGITAEILVFIFGLAGIICWLALPLLLALGFWVGFDLLI